MLRLAHKRCQIEFWAKLLNHNMESCGLQSLMHRNVAICSMDKSSAARVSRSPQRVRCE